MKAMNAGISSMRKEDRAIAGVANKSPVTT